MPLVSFEDVSLELGDQRLLAHADFAIEPGERVCLIGRNGAGKTSMLRLITGRLQPDRGEVRYQSRIRISELEQALPEELGQTVREYVTAGLADLQELIDLYERRSREALDRKGLLELEALHREIDAHGGWRVDQRVETVLSEMDLPAGMRLGDLSGGWQRRVGLARAIVGNAELLLLDEPTNHLDLSTIQWLEDRIYHYAGSVLFITHDRAFLRRLATRVVEIDRTRLVSWPGNYDDYLALKEKALAEDARRDALFDKRLAQEEAWIRQGLKARRTRNEGRVRALVAMREQAARRLKPQGQARIRVQHGGQSGRKVVELRNVTHGYGAEPLVRNLSLRIMRGDRMGLIGNNGVGKSTLLRILVGEVVPDSGTVEAGANLEIGYFDQLRRRLDPEKTVAETVADGRDHVVVNGKPRHVVGYLKGFLFTPKRAMSPVAALSGGERNRVLLARLLTRPANLLVLDEPTNDLDIETLEVLEEQLVDYRGTLLVVSHDRSFLDNCVTSTLVFEDAGVIRRHAGGYTDWARRGKTLAVTDDPNRKAARNAPRQPREPGSRPAKLSYKLQLELDGLPDRIEALEKAVAALEEETRQPDFYTRPFDAVRPVLDELETAKATLDEAVERWSELETLKQEGDRRPQSVAEEQGPRPQQHRQGDLHDL